MAERINYTLESQLFDSPELKTEINENRQLIQTVIQDVPQIQTVLQNGGINISSQINAPFIEVTSVNGMTGDVVVNPLVSSFQANHFYKKDSLITYNGSLYIAKADFTSTANFSETDWEKVQSSGGISSWDDIQDKPNFATVATTGAYSDLTGTPTFSEVAFSGAYGDLSGTPSIPAPANNGVLTIERNGTQVATFSANSSSNVTASITTPTLTSQLENDSGYIRAIDGEETSPEPWILASDIIWSSLIDKIYPVGSIYMSATLSTPTQVANALGGTWIAWGAGKVPVGVDANDASFSLPEETGGSKTHTHTYGIRYGEYYGTVGAPIKLYNNGSWQNSTTSGNDTYSHTTTTGTASGSIVNYQGTASTTSGSNLQPYITCYMYKRTA